VSRTGHTFNGWFTESTGGTKVTETTIVINNDDHTLFAQWTPIATPPDTNDLSITYNGNGATGGSVPVNNNSYENGASVAVAANPGDLVRSGYTFLGWAYSSTATVADFVVHNNSVSPPNFTIYNDVTLFATWSPIYYTVSYQPGTHGTFTTQVTNNLRYGDLTPTAPTTTGETGWNFNGWLPTPTTTVTGNATYIAQWTQEPTPTLSASPMPTSTVTPTLLPTLTPIPTATLIPTVPPMGDNEPMFAVANLMLSVVGVILTILLMIYVLMQQRQTQKSKQRSISKQSGKQDDYGKRNEQCRHLWLITAVIMGIAGVLVFLLTEDMSNTMTIVDKWTSVNVAIFTVEILAIAFLFKHKKVTK
jgi:uncharacterized repeat protein (TIGR02543 family)